MKTGICILVISSLLVFSCDIPCDENYSEGLPWLEREIKTLEQSGPSQFYYVTQAEYKRTTVYIVKHCCPYCLTTPPRVFDCSGAIIGYLGDDIDADKLKDEILYWQPDNFACSGIRFGA